MAKPVGTVRIPLAIANMVAKKKDDLSRKITEAQAHNDRKEWGPEIEANEDEAHQLLEMAKGIRANRESPIKIISAANKLLAAINVLDGKLHPKTEDELKEIGRQDPGHAVTGHLPIDKGRAETLPALTSLDQAMEAFIGPGGVVGAQPPVTPPTPSARPPAAPPPGMVSALDPELDFSRMEPRRAALLRLSALYELMNVERPGIAALLLQIIDNVKKI